MRTETVTCDNCAGPIGKIPCMAQFIVRTDGDTQRMIVRVSTEPARDGYPVNIDLCGPCQCRIAIAAATKVLERVAPDEAKEGGDEG